MTGFIRVLGRLDLLGRPFYHDDVQRAMAPEGHGHERLFDAASESIRLMQEAGAIEPSGSAWTITAKGADMCKRPAWS